MDTQIFDRFKDVLVSPDTPTVRDKRLLMDADGRLEIFYAPFEYINPRSRLILVGITPGPTQMFNANKVARSALLEGKSSAEAVQLAKEQGAFSGTVMRSNLTKQLNDWGFNQWLGIDCCSELFASSKHLVQTTSLLRYPTFVGGDDYRGTPDMTKQPLLARYLMDHFAREFDALPNALVIPLGPTVLKVMDWLSAKGIVSRDRVIRGLLHPSPNCTYRIDYLIGDRKSPIPHATNPLPYDEGRKSFKRMYLER